MKIHRVKSFVGTTSKIHLVKLFVGVLMCSLFEFVRRYVQRVNVELLARLYHNMPYHTYMSELADEFDDVLIRTDVKKDLKYDVFKLGTLTYYCEEANILQVRMYR